MIVRVSLTLWTNVLRPSAIKSKHNAVSEQRAVAKVYD